MYRIAIVEDDYESRNMFKEYVFRYQSESGMQFRVSEFTNGLNFISDYTADFDVIFMDIDMPHMDGLRAAGELRRVDQNVCLIFATNMALTITEAPTKIRPTPNKNNPAEIPLEGCKAKTNPNASFTTPSANVGSHLSCAFQRRKAR